MNEDNIVRAYSTSIILLICHVVLLWDGVDWTGCFTFIIHHFALFVSYMKLYVKRDISEYKDLNI